MIKTKISYHMVKAEQLDKVFDHPDRHFSLETGSMPEIVVGDEIRLKQVLINLVKNALKFTFNGMIRIYMAYDSDSHSLKTHIVDNGKGIAHKD